MTTTRIVVIAACLLAPVGLGAQTAPAPAGGPVEGVVTVGGTGSTTQGALERAGEFQVMEDALANLGLQIWGERGRSRFDLVAEQGGDARQQRYRADITINRRVTAVVRYERFPHRLDHDPLTWMSAASNLGGGPFVVRATDTDPGAAYALARGELESRLEFTAPLPRAGALKFFVGHRQEWRDGAHQALTTSHCEACHTESFTRRLDQRTRDLIAGTRLEAGRLAVEYAYTARRFDERSATPTNVYDRAIHPLSRADVFYNRVSYDERNGPLPFDSVPGLAKDSHVVRASVALPRDASLYGHATHSVSRNLDTEVETAVRGASGRLVVPFGRKVVLRGSVQRFSIDSDSVFVDVGEPVAPGGPSAGLTYAQAYPGLGEVDYLRHSALSRTPTLARIELLYRPARRTSVRVGYDWEEVTRDAFEVHRTTTQTLRAWARGSPDKRFTWQARGSYDWITDPFVHERGAMPAVLQPFASPGNVPFTGAQYYDMYRARQANLSSYPTARGLFEPSFTWTPDERVSLSAFYRFRAAENDDLNYSTWSQQAHAPGIQFWAAPDDRVSLHAGYAYQRERTETLFSTLAFVG
ncbi:MAG: GSU2204 family CXXCH-containing (seleno)protein [Acidobacteriota bacterium]